MHNSVTEVYQSISGSETVTWHFTLHNTHKQAGTYATMYWKAQLQQLVQDIQI